MRPFVDLRQLVVGAGEADVHSFDFAEPTFAFGFGDAGDEVVADLGESVVLCGVGPEHRAAAACMFVACAGEADGQDRRAGPAQPRWYPPVRDAWRGERDERCAGGDGDGRGKGGFEVGLVDRSLALADPAP
ncbi:hypothetical protein [Actinoplanes flavus]|uniref:Uncharacterized protein n=1 Tax=Actinoplanes flavus TaxID=2820290 RepID=A0ABS3UZ68_9ACTN|nr:hypothetical protein [Actinoplanes flavus]MBO3743875.1 hypothetical protein [Actinoplanes flavus]